MMLARNDNNLCGIASDASFPTGFVASGNVDVNQDVMPNGGSMILVGQSLMAFVILALHWI